MGWAFDNVSRWAAAQAGAQAAARQIDQDARRRDLEARGVPRLEWPLELFTDRRERREQRAARGLRKETNHLLHAILSFITFGCWLPIWLLVTVWNRMGFTLTRKPVAR